MLHRRHSLIAVTLMTAAALFTQSADAQMVAFTGKDSNSPETMAFVALEDIPSGTKIFFTADDYDNTSGQFIGGLEGTVLFTTSGTITTGTVIQIQETAANSFAVTGNPGTAVHVGPGDWSAVSGDPMYAFSASNDATPATTVTEVHAMLWVTNTAFGTRDPSTGTVAYADAIVVDNGFMAANTAADFTGDRSSATFTTLADSSNFTVGDNVLDLTPFSSVPVELQSFDVE